MSEFRFDYDPDIPAGRLVLWFHNQGNVVHRPTIVALPEDLPPIDEQLHGSERRSLAALAGTPFRPPGTSSAVAVDLEAGQRYAIICFLEGEDGEPHALKGMNTEFRAGQLGEGSR